MCRLNLFDLAWFRTLVEASSAVDNKKFKLRGFTDFIFNFGNFVRLGHKRLFDSNSPNTSNQGLWETQGLLMAEKLYSSPMMACGLQGEGEVELRHFNMQMSGLFAAGMLGFTPSYLNDYIDKYLALLSRTDFQDPLSHQALPMTAHVLGHIYNKRFTIADIPTEMVKFIKFAKNHIIEYPEKFSTENRAQIHALILTIDTQTDPAYCSVLVAEAPQLISKVPDRLLVYVNRLVSLMSPDLLSEQAKIAVLTRTEKLLELGQKSGFQQDFLPITHKIDDKKMINGIYACWLLAEIDCLAKIDQVILKDFLQTAILFVLQFPDKKALLQILFEVLADVKGQNLA